MTYRYVLKRTEFSSARYGPCEVCGHHCPEVWTQTTHEPFDSHGEQGESHRGTRFGHRACLLAERGSHGEAKRIAERKARALAEVRALTGGASCAPLPESP